MKTQLGTPYPMSRSTFLELALFRKSRVALMLFGLLCSLPIGASPSSAEDFPTRYITMYVPFSAGSPQDTLGRIIAQGMTETLGQQVIVENLGGAGGTLAAKRVADARPDGYSIVLGTVGTHAQSQTLYKHPLYNAVQDFTPVALVAETPIALIVRKTLPVKDLQEFVAYARANQEKMQFGSSGPGSATHLGCVVLDTAMGTHITNVSYRGTGEAMQGLQAGTIDYLCDIIATAKAQIDGDRVNGIAMMTKARAAVLPALPTAIEQGLNVEAYTWSAIFLPKGASPTIVTTLNDAARKAMNAPATRERLQTLGAIVVAPERQTSTYLGEFVKSEIEKWAVPIKASGVSVE